MCNFPFTCVSVFLHPRYLTKSYKYNNFIEYVGSNFFKEKYAISTTLAEMKTILRIYVTSITLEIFCMKMVLTNVSYFC